MPAWCTYGLTLIILVQVRHIGKREGPGDEVCENNYQRMSNILNAQMLVAHIAQHCTWLKINVVEMVEKTEILSNSRLVFYLISTLA